MRLLINFATRGRYEKCIQALKSMLDTIHTNNYQVILTVDDDDEQMALPKTKWLEEYKQITVVRGTSESKVHAINRGMAHAREWDWMINFSDDMNFICQSWDRNMWELIEKQWGGSLDFFAHFNDGYAADKLPTMSVMGREYYNRDGYVYHPSYKSFSCDAEAMYVAMMRGKHHYFPQVFFHHNHGVNIRIKLDDTYRMNDRFMAGDTTNYFERIARGFDVENPVMIPDVVSHYMSMRIPEPRVDVKNPSLAILIPTIAGREDMYHRLMKILAPQLEQYSNSAQVYTLKDKRGDRTIGEKRNILTEWAIVKGHTHRAFIDDDDTVSTDYLHLNMPGVFKMFDCNSLVGIYSVNGVVNPKKHIFFHSLKYDRWYEDDQYYYRNPNHLNVCSLEKIGHVKFQHKNFGEDGCWSEEIARQKLLKTEYSIDTPFYNYLFRTKPTGI